MTVGVVGIGTMGLPIARNLLRAGHRVVVWNRTPTSCQPLVELGAELAESVDALCARAEVVLLVLLHEHAVDEVLGRNSACFGPRVANRTIVLVGTTCPDYSRALERDVLGSGGQYVEAPVSGSRIPAEQGTLIGMVAGEADAVERVLPLLDILCSRVFRCGTVPDALRLKLAVNHYLIGMVTVLAEVVHAARAGGLDLQLLQAILDNGPMASDVSKTKLAKLIDRDFAPQAAIRDVATIAGLVEQQAHAAHAQVPLIEKCAAMFREARDNGYGDRDMVGVASARSSASGRPPPHPVGNIDVR